MGSEKMSEVLIFSFFGFADKKTNFEVSQSLGVIECAPLLVTVAVTTTKLCPSLVFTFVAFPMATLTPCLS